MHSDFPLDFSLSLCYLNLFRVSDVVATFNLHFLVLKYCLTDILYTED